MILFFCPFFFLDKKEPKNQECRIASGRHSALRSWMVTFLVFIFLVSYLFGVAKQAKCYRGNAYYLFQLLNMLLSNFNIRN